MSLDSESSPFSSRDWFFPSPSFIHSSRYSANSPVYPRRFTTIPRSSRRSLPDPDGLSNHSSFQKVSPPPPTPYSESKYARPRRRVDLSRRAEKHSERDESDAASKEKAGVSDAAKIKAEGSGQTNVKFSGQSPEFRRRLAFYAALLITIFPVLVQKNLSLRSQVIELQGQISRLNVRLQNCGLDDPLYIDPISEGGEIPFRGLKRLALLVALSLLSTPIIVFKYVDHVSKSRSSEISEGVSLNKQLAYRVDLFLSVHPYAKPLMLLVATLLLICLGGLALFGVTDDSLADCLWLAWTYVADSGNHANSEGIGPRLVSVSISFGGMLVFAMMLGLVSDAISEKFDSLRKEEVK